MSDRSKIEWTDATWNPLRARDPASGKIGHHCVKISPACAHCYAASMNRRFGTGLEYSAGSSSQVFLDGLVLVKPLAWKRPRKIFPCSMTDLFGDWVSVDDIAKIVDVMAAAWRHTFQVLTKRPERMAAIMPKLAKRHTAKDGSGWPLPNVWLGVTVEDHQRAEERREPLRRIAEMGWTTFVSNEPALELIDWTGWEFVKQIISGGEAGPGSRPSHPQLFRATRDFCASHDIAFFFKQWGDWVPWVGQSLDALPLNKPQRNAEVMIDGTLQTETIGHGGELMARVGKNKAGRSLDGRTWDQFPEAKEVLC
jgi:protein gp37